MLAYAEVPQWWYALMGTIAFALGIITIEVWDTKVSSSRETVLCYRDPDVTELSLAEYSADMDLSYLSGRTLFLSSSR
jgi:hypothetical protein